MSGTDVEWMVVSAPEWLRESLIAMEVNSAISLRARYAMSRTDLTYAATSRYRSSTWATTTCLCTLSPYAMADTNLVYAARRVCYRSARCPVQT
eukprot:1642601-Rhodomonas_salina.3